VIAATSCEVNLDTTSTGRVRDVLTACFPHNTIVINSVVTHVSAAPSLDASHPGLATHTSSLVCWFRLQLHIQHNGFNMEEHDKLQRLKFNDQDFNKLLTLSWTLDTHGLTVIRHDLHRHTSFFRSPVDKVLSFFTILIHGYRVVDSQVRFSMSLADFIFNQIQTIPQNPKCLKSHAISVFDQYADQFANMLLICFNGDQSEAHVLSFVSVKRQLGEWASSKFKMKWDGKNWSLYQGDSLIARQELSFYKSDCIPSLGCVQSSGEWKTQSGSPFSKIQIQVASPSEISAHCSVSSSAVTSSAIPTVSGTLPQPPPINTKQTSYKNPEPVPSLFTFFDLVGMDSILNAIELLAGPLTSLHQLGSPLYESLKTLLQRYLTLWSLRNDENDKWETFYNSAIKSLETTLSRDDHPPPISTFIQSMNTYGCYQTHRLFSTTERLMLMVSCSWPAFKWANIAQKKSNETQTRIRGMSFSHPRVVQFMRQRMLDQQFINDDDFPPQFSWYSYVNIASNMCHSSLVTWEWRKDHCFIFDTTSSVPFLRLKGCGKVFNADGVYAATKHRHNGKLVYAVLTSDVIGEFEANGVSLPALPIISGCVSLPTILLVTLEAEAEPTLHAVQFSFALHLNEPLIKLESHGAYHIFFSVHPQTAAFLYCRMHVKPTLETWGGPLPQMGSETVVRFPFGCYIECRDEIVLKKDMVSLTDQADHSDAQPGPQNWHSNLDPVCCTPNTFNENGIVHENIFENGNKSKSGGGKTSKKKVKKSSTYFSLCNAHLSSWSALCAVFHDTYIGVLLDSKWVHVKIHDGCCFLFSFWLKHFGIGKEYFNWHLRLHGYYHSKDIRHLPVNSPESLFVLFAAIKIITQRKSFDQTSQAGLESLILDMLITHTDKTLDCEAPPSFRALDSGIIKTHARALHEFLYPSADDIELNIDDSEMIDTTENAHQPLLFESNRLKQPYAVEMLQHIDENKTDDSGTLVTAETGCHHVLSTSIHLKAIIPAVPVDTSVTDIIEISDGAIPAVLLGKNDARIKPTQDVTPNHRDSKRANTLPELPILRPSSGISSSTIMDHRRTLNFCGIVALESAHVDAFTACRSAFLYDFPKYDSSHHSPETLCRGSKVVNVSDCRIPSLTLMVNDACIDWFFMALTALFPAYMYLPCSICGYELEMSSTQKNLLQSWKANFFRKRPVAVLLPLNFPKHWGLCTISCDWEKQSKSLQCITVVLMESFSQKIYAEQSVKWITLNIFPIFQAKNSKFSSIDIPDLQRGGIANNHCGVYCMAIGLNFVMKTLATMSSRLIPQDCVHDTSKVGLELRKMVSWDAVQDPPLLDACLSMCPLFHPYSSIIVESNPWWIRLPYDLRESLNIVLESKDKFLMSGFTHNTKSGSQFEAEQIVHGSNGLARNDGFKFSSSSICNKNKVITEGPFFFSNDQYFVKVHLIGLLNHLQVDHVSVQRAAFAFQEAAGSDYVCGDHGWWCKTFGLIRIGLSNPCVFVCIARHKLQCPDTIEPRRACEAFGNISKSQTKPALHNDPHRCNMGIIQINGAQQLQVHDLTHVSRLGEISLPQLAIFIRLYYNSVNERTTVLMEKLLIPQIRQSGLHATHSYFAQIYCNQKFFTAAFDSDAFEKSPATSWCYCAWLHLMENVADPEVKFYEPRNCFVIGCRLRICADTNAQNVPCELQFTTIQVHNGCGIKIQSCTIQSAGDCLDALIQEGQCSKDLNTQDDTETFLEAVLQLATSLCSTATPAYQVDRVCIPSDSPQNHGECCSVPFGMKNAGSLCCYISLFQAWFHIKSFRKAVFDASLNSGSHPFTLYLSTIFHCLQTGKTVDLKVFFPAFALCVYQSNVLLSQPVVYFFGVGRMGRHHDVVEIYNKFVDLLGVTANTLFGFTMVSHISCDNFEDDFSKEHEDLYNSLNLEISSSLSTSISKCLQSHNTSYLLGDSQWQSRSHGLQDATLKRICKKAPAILHLTLKRFQYDRSSSKILKSVTFGNALDLETLEGTAKYVLASVLVHTGTCARGHYFSFVKKQNCWFRCDDETVTEVSEYEAIHANFGGKMSKKGLLNPFQPTAYMLIYVLDSAEGTSAEPLISEHSQQKYETCVNYLEVKYQSHSQLTESLVHKQYVYSWHVLETLFRNSDNAFQTLFADPHFSARSNTTRRIEFITVDLEAQDTVESALRNQNLSNESVDSEMLHLHLLRTMPSQSSGAHAKIQKNLQRYVFADTLVLASGTKYVLYSVVAHACGSNPWVVFTRPDCWRPEMWGFWHRCEPQSDRCVSIQAVESEEAFDDNFGGKEIEVGAKRALSTILDPRQRTAQILIYVKVSDNASASGYDLVIPTDTIVGTVSTNQQQPALEAPRPDLYESCSSDNSDNETNRETAQVPQRKRQASDVTLLLPQALNKQFNFLQKTRKVSSEVWMNCVKSIKIRFPNYAPPPHVHAMSNPKSSLTNNLLNCTHLECRIVVVGPEVKNQRECLDFIQNHNVLSVDTETAYPRFPENGAPISLMQLGTNETVFLIQVAKVGETFLSLLAIALGPDKLLVHWGGSDKNAIKTALDKPCSAQWHDLQADLSPSSSQTGLDDSMNTYLQNLYCLSKEWTLSGWDLQNLDHRQKAYAALDVCSCHILYLHHKLKLAIFQRDTGSKFHSFFTPTSCKKGATLLKHGVSFEKTCCSHYVRGELIQGLFAQISDSCVVVTPRGYPSIDWDEIDNPNLVSEFVTMLNSKKFCCSTCSDLQWFQAIGFTSLEFKVVPGITSTFSFQRGKSVHSVAVQIPSSSRSQKFMPEAYLCLSMLGSFFSIKLGAVDDSRLVHSVLCDCRYGFIRYTLSYFAQE